MSSIEGEGRERPTCDDREREEVTSPIAAGKGEEECPASQ